MSNCPLEQAVFTSAQTGRGSGYQLVAQSEGISRDDARELTAWGPSHDSMLFPDLGRASLSFFGLPSGAFGLGRTTANGSEYSQRRGMRIYTHFLVASPKTLARFSNHPISLLKAALADGVLDPQQEVDPQMSTISITGSASVIDRTSIRRVRDQIGDERLVTILDAMLSDEKVAITGGQSPEVLFAALISCLPLSIRTTFPLTTGLKFSRRRACRLLVVSDDAAEHRQIQRLGTHRLIDLGDTSMVDSPLRHDWARFVYKTLSSDRLDLLAEEVRKPHETPMIDWMERTVPKVSSSDHSSAQRTDMCKEEGVLIADLETLEPIDDAVFETLEGKSDSLVRLRQLWPTVRGSLSDSMIEESREHYLQRALAVWKQQANDPETSTTDLAADLLDLLCVVLDQ